MEIYIDDVRMDTDARSVVSVTVSVASVTSPEWGRTGYAGGISLPATARNRAVMGDCEQIAAAERFNERLHDGRVEHDGCVIMEGTARMIRCESGPSGSRYTVAVLGAGKKWAAHASRHGLSSLLPEWSARITPQTIAESWTAAEAPVRWLPVERGEHVPVSSSVGLKPAERVLTASDYHPFLHVAALVKAIFADAGYQVDSEFFDTDFFRSLYISGRYAARDASAMIRRMDFSAARAEAATAVADSEGVVTADPLAKANTLGNIVDSADPEVLSGAGVYDRGGCLLTDGGRIRFVPPSPVSVGFEFRFRYVTDCRIESRTALSGFDRIWVGGGQLFRFVLPNTWPDRRAEFRTNRQYRCVVFDFAGGSLFLTVDVRTSPSATPVRRRIAEIVSRSQTVSLLGSGTCSNLRLTVDGVTEYGGDWALYDGYVEEYGQTEVEVTLRSPVESVTPSSPRYFDTVYFAGAQAGWSLTLLEAVLRPVFAPHPTVGDTVAFADVAAYGVSRMALVRSLRQMFGLCFYTDETGRRVRIEPRRGFFSDRTVDWTARQDVSRPVTVEELADGLPGTVEWEYAAGDEASAEYNAENGGRLGRWSAQVANPAREGESRTYTDGFLATTVNAVGCLPSAGAASLPVVRVASGGEGTEDLNFPVRIVRYHGMAALPAGQRWGWPSFGGEYPLSGFHLATAPGGPTEADRRSLCYEDRDGMRGLHEWWDGLLETCNRGRRVRARVRLGAADIAALLGPDPLGCDLRALFRLRIGGEVCFLRLEEVAGYDPDAVSTECVFITDV